MTRPPLTIKSYFDAGTGTAKAAPAAVKKNCRLFNIVSTSEVEGAILTYGSFRSLCNSSLMEMR